MEADSFGVKNTMSTQPGRMLKKFPDIYEINCRKTPSKVCCNGLVSVYGGKNLIRPSYALQTFAGTVGGCPYTKTPA